MLLTRTGLAAAAAAVGLLAGGCSADPAPATAGSSAPGSASASSAPSQSPEPVPSGGYLALGDSLAAGYQPGGAELRDTAYPALTATRLGRDGPELTVENLGCSGETSGTLLDGGTCVFDEGSQLAQAEAWLEENAGEVRLVTIDIGGNDLLRCATRQLTVDQTCVDRGVRSVSRNLPEVLERLRAAAGDEVPVLVLGYYNPWLASGYLEEGQDQLAAAADAFTRLDDAIEKAADGAGATYVSLDEAFALDDETPTTFGGREVPTNVAQVCSLTYTCTAGDIHLTEEGAATVARVLADAAREAGVTG
jgi:lysophospholipase L1-like esterase